MREGQHSPHSEEEPHQDDEQRRSRDEALAAADEDADKRLAYERDRTLQSARFLGEGGTYVHDEGTREPRLEVASASIEKSRASRDNSAEVVRQIEALSLERGEPINFYWEFEGATQHESGRFIRIGEEMLEFYSWDGHYRAVALSHIRSVEKSTL